MKIEHCAFEHRSTFGIDKKFDTIAFDHRVTGLLFVENHLILQTGTPAFRNLYTKTLFLR